MCYCIRNNMEGGGGGVHSVNTKYIPHNHVWKDMELAPFVIVLFAPDAAGKCY